jgi:rhodanese-related sulfurtransferase
MLEAIKKLFKITTVDYSELMDKGAVIIDVRTPQEYDNGHIKGSKNLPLAELSHRLKSVSDKDKNYIVVCASGMRSASAKSMMKRNGYQHVYNGGGWQSLRSKI